MKTQIEVIGLGAGDLDQLTIGLYHKLINAEVPLFVRTNDHPVLESLEKQGVNFTSFDPIYKQHDQFEEVYEAIVEQLLKQAKHNKHILYAVPGHPMLAERTVQLLLEQDEVNIDIVGGQSYLDALFTAIHIDPIEGFQFLDATSFERSQINYMQHLIFCQVYDQMVASELKLTLLEDLQPDHPVVIIKSVGSSKAEMETIPLVELDQCVELSNLTSVYVHPAKKEVLNHQFNRLREIIAVLRGPSGCPWDKKQTHESLRHYLIEEAYELIDAINQEDDHHIIEELGDILLQVMLHSQIGEDHGYFTVDDVVRSITDKMIRRHPHVFGDVKAEDTETVIANWKAIKADEKADQITDSLLDRIPQSASTLVRAEAIQKEAAKVGFDWDNPEDIWLKVTEEIEEVKQAIESGRSVEIEAEFGDLIFAIINLARYYKVNSDLALRRTNIKFTRRFQYIERKVLDAGSEWVNMSIKELDHLWDEAKRRMTDET
ncbi:nucleoside triphosphate pyrophosphohydrolase [Amphibacillus cookii]|uniref:nucleoside triphosphate pyrophosphohydrolase n=1 Tax=Amphibacillus cookii TaxID=767787 RepID=UPI001959FCB1|nr:nucleoside triphosphate pyrophosphohydrolase [Amphibacillus cookii]